MPLVCEAALNAGFGGESSEGNESSAEFAMRVSIDMDFEIPRRDPSSTSVRAEVLALSELALDVAVGEVLLLVWAVDCEPARDLDSLRDDQKLLPPLLDATLLLTALSSTVFVARTEPLPRDDFKLGMPSSDRRFDIVAAGSVVCSGVHKRSNVSLRICLCGIDCWLA